MQSLLRTTVLCIAGVFTLSGPAFGEEAGTPSGEGEATEDGADEEAAPESTQSTSASSSTEPEPLSVRIGRVEMVLIENEDPESALEFGQALMGEAGDDVRLNMLIAACLMRLERREEALAKFRRVAELTERSDRETHMHALYNIARALQGMGQLGEAAEAYERYVSFVRSHEELPGLADAASQMATALRSRSTR